MISGLMFTFLRLLELVTLIPTIGMLSYFVNIFVNNNQLTPNFILVLFIISVLAGVWALLTLLRRDSTRRSALFVAFIDICFVGAFIGAVYELRFITHQTCNVISGGIVGDPGIDTNGNTITIGGPTFSYTPFTVDPSKTCNMLKASFAFGIMNCVFFFFSALMALMMHRHERTVVVEKSTYRRRSHESRRGHSSHGGTRRSHSRDSRRNYYV